jgi:hypothetical protein
MADSLGMDVCKGTEKLVDIQLDLENRHGGLHLVEVSRRTVNGFRDILLYKIEVDLVLLSRSKWLACANLPCGVGRTYSLTVGIVKCLEFDDVWMTNDAHDLQLAVLRGVSSDRSTKASRAP